jgi:hypothetical protein
MFGAEPDRLVREWVEPLLAAVTLSWPAGDPGACPRRCAVLEWAASGAMALTGRPGGPASVSPAPVLAMLGAATDTLARATGLTGTAVRADPAALLTGRAALAGLSRHGLVSAGGSTRLLRAADGWCAVTLSRPDDISSVPAILGSLGLHGDAEAGPAIGTGGDEGAGPWPALEAAALAVPAVTLASAAQLLGVPAAALPAGLPTAARDPAQAPWQVTRIAPGSPAARLAGAVVADLSSMWAGPLCARLLGLAGARVIKVESTARPDGARSGDHRFFDWLHAGHRSLALDFQTESGRTALATLLRTADVVIEASRPRALANLGLAPEMIDHPDGQVWVGITGYGRSQPRLVAFGDDAAVAGGLVGWDGGDDPVFCADAIADPLSGVCAALAAACSVAAGGGHLIDVSMRAAAAAFAAAPAPDHGPHEISSRGRVACPYLGMEQPVLPPRRPTVTGHARPIGADSADVLAWLAER